MIAKGFAGLALVDVCVTVNAAVRAGVVGADVGAFSAAAFFPCWFVLELKTAGKE